MRRVVLSDGADLAEWRSQARALLAAGIPPEQVQWQAGGQQDLLLGVPPEAPASVASSARVGNVPRDFLVLAALVLAHAEPRRHAVLYRLLWRLVHGERALLSLVTDDDISWAMRAAKAVRREKHKMKAFVRFREVAGPDGPVFIPWFQPEHDLHPQLAPFFLRRVRGNRVLGPPPGGRGRPANPASPHPPGANGDCCAVSGATPRRRVPRSGGRPLPPVCHGGGGVRGPCTRRTRPSCCWAWRRPCRSRGTRPASLPRGAGCGGRWTTSLTRGGL